MACEYQIRDNGEDFQVALIRDGVQVGNLIFEDDGTGLAFEEAYALAEIWKKFPAATVSGLKLA